MAKDTSVSREKRVPKPPPSVLSPLQLDPDPPGLLTVIRRLQDLKPHPRNYQKHPKDQLEHIKRSLQEHGLYRPVVIARGDVILAGHGLAIAAREIGWETIACYFRDVDPDSPEALRLLAGDNEIGRTAERDDRLLTEMLADVKSDVSGGGLLGTGLDEQMLAGLIFVTRDADEVRTRDHAAEWVGLPAFSGKEDDVKVVMIFLTKADRDEWVRKQAEAGFPMKLHYRTESTWSTWWPPKERDDLQSVRFEVPAGEPDAKP